MASKLGTAFVFTILSSAAPAALADCAPMTEDEVMAAEMQRYEAHTGDDFE